MEEQKKPNTFKSLEEAGKIDTTPKEQAPVSAPGEVSMENFSDKSVGEKKKYNRPNLDKTEDVVEMFQVFSANTEDEPKESKKKTSKYWPVSIVLTYKSENEDGMKNREYISGGRQFVNRDGNPSEINFWYEGGKTQLNILWELVAKKLAIEPKDMSPRKFVAFLNGTPKVRIVSTKTDNYSDAPGAPEFVYKNMPGEFL